MPTLEDKDDKNRKNRAGLNRLAASNLDKEDWLTILGRIGTRALAGLGETSAVVKVESKSPDSLSNVIRENLFRYVVDDFRKRMDTALEWLYEEWYNDKVQMMSGNDSVLHYEKWVLKVMDGILPFLDRKDLKIVINFLGGIPGLSVDVLNKFKTLCQNPAVMTMALQSLLYLVAYRLPARELVLDTVEDIWHSCKTPRYHSYCQDPSTNITQMRMLGLQS